jgi:hypothetical protein
VTLKLTGENKTVNIIYYRTYVILDLLAATYLSICPDFLKNYLETGSKYIKLLSINSIKEHNV